MASRYKVDIDESDGLIFTPIGEVTGPIPDDIQIFIIRCEQFVDRIRQQVAKGSGRTNYIIIKLLPIARIGLQDGNLIDGNDQLTKLDTVDLTTKYYQIVMDPRSDFSGELHPWISLPLPKEVTALINRISRTFNKVNNLLEPDHTSGHDIKPKSKWYLDLLLGYAYLGLQRGDVDAANLALDEFETIFLKNEGASIRNQYIKSTLKITGAIFVISFIFLLASGLNIKPLLIYIFEYFGINIQSVIINMPALIDLNDFGENFFPTLLSVTIGICLGMSFFALIQSPSVTFQVLSDNLSQ